MKNESIDFFPRIFTFSKIACVGARLLERIFQYSAYYFARAAIFSYKYLFNMCDYNDGTDACTARVKRLKLKKKHFFLYIYSTIIW